MNTENRQCQNCRKDFVIESDDFSFYEKMKVPPPTWCPNCRFQQRLLFRNERNYYRRDCDFCKQQIIATYPASVPFPVYCVKCWWSDNWDAYSYGRDFDFSRPFFEQFHELMNVAPVIAIMNDDSIASVNSGYTYDWFYSKNCYGDVCGWYSENVLYSYHIEYGKDIIDSMHIRESELIYECSICFKVSKCAYCVNCRECQECYISYDLQGCLNCTMCVGLRNKQYCILNKQYTKEEYFKKLKELNLADRVSLEKHIAEFKEFILKNPRRYAYVLKSVNSTGNFIINCKNAKQTYFGEGIENSVSNIIVSDVKEVHDCNMTGQAELCYNCNVADHGYMNSFNSFCFKSRYVEYSHLSPLAEKCFGSASLKKGSYSILNKKYSKEDYEELRTKIIEHMHKGGEYGKFFPYALSPFAYNETAAQEWFPLTQEAAVAQGYRWKEQEGRNYQITKKAAELPTTIEKVGDDILQDVIECSHNGKCNEVCTTAFRITMAELQLHRKLNMPLPQLCPNCRHYSRTKNRGSLLLHHRQCNCVGEKSSNELYTNLTSHYHKEAPCNNTFETPFSSDAPEIVYCEQCYNAEVA